MLYNYIMYSSHYQRGMNTTGFIVRLRNCRFCVFLALVVLLLAGTATPLHAQTANGYVIYCDDYSLFLIHDASTGELNTAGVGTFDPATCLWSVGSNYIRPTSDNGTSVLGNMYLTHSSNDLGSSTTAATWTNAAANGQPQYADGNRTYVLRVTGSTTWQVSRNSTSHRGRIYAVTSTSTQGEAVAATYHGTLGGTTDFYSVGATYTYVPTVTHTAAYNKTNTTYTATTIGSLGTIVTGTAPAPTAVSLASGWTVVWSLSDDTYASINAATGELTVNTLPATYAAATVSYTATHTSSGAVVEASLPVAFYASMEVKENIIGGTTGRSGGVVTLNDYEPHEWSYYSDASLPAELRSLNPANVKITYFGNGQTANNMTTTDNADNPTAFDAKSTGVQVGIGEPEHTFVYYKTLERTTGSAYGSATYDYTTIPNPFSIRPTYGTVTSGNVGTFTGWRGFYKWRIKSVDGGTISGKDVGETIDAEATISLIPTSEYGMTIELEALWAAAAVSTSAVPTTYSGVERNFYVGTSNVFTGTDAGTCSSFYPNGTTNGYTAAAMSNRSSITAGTAGADKRVEYYIFSSGTLNTGGHKVTVGRGVTSTGTPTITPLSGTINTATNALLRIESGTYGTANLYGSPSVGANLVHLDLILGSDYDRAAGDNNLLSIANSTTIQEGNHTATGSSWLSYKNLDIVVKSGKIQENYWNQSSASYSYSFYCRSTLTAAGSYPGITYLTVEGGEFASINGGRGNNQEGVALADDIVFSLRMKGGTVHGSIYGAASAYPSFGGRRFLITGGMVEGWIAGGCDGTSNGGGGTIGEAYIYVGGKSKIGNSANAGRVLDGTMGGNVFGAGRGMSNHGTDAQPASMRNAHIAVADEATVLRNVFGGGDYGYTGYSSESSVTDAATAANIYILGGTVEGKVFGGGNKAKGTNANIVMTGGLVRGGVYGGSNESGTMHNNTTLRIEGGTVGDTGIDPETSEVGHVFGSGYGSGTLVSGNVTVTIGAADGMTTHQDNPVINGNVYGGGHAAPYNSTGKTFKVTCQNGKIMGNVFGGGKGETATITGPTDVLLRGSVLVKGNVFGGGQAAAVNGSTHVQVE